LDEKVYEFDGKVFICSKRWMDGKIKCFTKFYVITIPALFQKPKKRADIRHSFAAI